MKKILIVEDDRIMTIALRDGLQSEGYETTIANDGAAALQLAAAQAFDLIVLDVMLPKVSGFDVCRQLRGAGNDVPIIILTARGLEVEKVLGLKIGADDYITKPFSLMELLARIEAVLRRSARANEKPERYQFGDVSLDFKKYEASKNGKALTLSPREYKLLQFMIEHRGEVVTRDQLLNHVWSYHSFPLTRTVDTHIAKVRQKIETNPNNPQYLLTVHGVGYKFIG